jgi:hypothetical protein
MNIIQINDEFTGEYLSMIKTELDETTIQINLSYYEEKAQEDYSLDDFILFLKEEYPKSKTDFIDIVGEVKF